MPDNLTSQLTFKELHLFPRVVFALGGVSIVAGIVRAEGLNISLGVAMLFGAIGVNIVYDLRRGQTSDEGKKREIEVRWMRGFYRTAFTIAFLALVGFAIILTRALGWDLLNLTK
ncbi:MAG: hypothetical protein WAU76_10570 [Candidatus Sulfotelmatobacter sp.]